MFTTRVRLGTGSTVPGDQEVRRQGAGYPLGKTLLEILAGTGPVRIGRRIRHTKRGLNRMAIEPASIDVPGNPNSVWNACWRNRRQKRAGGKSQLEKVNGLEGFRGYDGLHRESKGERATLGGETF